MKLFCRFLLLCVLFQLTSCASLERRIQQNQSAFDQLSPQTRERIRRGEISVGDSPEVIRIAKGEPRYIRERKTDGAEMSIWVWTMLRTTSSVQSVYVSGRYGRGGTQLIDVDQVQEIETLRVEFLNDQAVVIEELQK